MNLLRTSVLTGLALTGFLVTQPVHATTYTLSGGPSGADLTGWAHNSGLSPNPEDVYVGPILMTVTPSDSAAFTQWVYCTDLITNYINGKTYTLSNTDLKTGLVTVWGSPTGAIKYQQITNLLYGTDSLMPSSATASQGAAVQAALWEIENEAGTSGYDVSYVVSGSNNFYVTASSTSGASSTAASFAALANGYLANATNGTWVAPLSSAAMQYTPLNPADNQSFGYISLTGGGHATPVPEPSGASVLSLAFAGLLLARLGVRRKV